MKKKTKKDRKRQKKTNLREKDQKKTKKGKKTKKRDGKKWRFWDKRYEKRQKNKLKKGKKRRFWDKKKMKKGFQEADRNVQKSIKNDIDTISRFSLPFCGFVGLGGGGVKNRSFFVVIFGLKRS